MGVENGKDRRSNGNELSFYLFLGNIYFEDKVSCLKEKIVPKTTVLEGAHKPIWLTFL